MTDRNENRDQSGRERREEVYESPPGRQGIIILRKPWQRAVFIAGLAGGVVLALILSIAAA